MALLIEASDAPERWQIVSLDLFEIDLPDDSGLYQRLRAELDACATVSSSLSDWSRREVVENCKRKHSGMEVFIFGPDSLDPVLVLVQPGHLINFFKLESDEIASLSGYLELYSPGEQSPDETKPEEPMPPIALIG